MTGDELFFWFIVTSYIVLGGLLWKAEIEFRKAKNLARKYGEKI